MHAQVFDTGATPTSTGSWSAESRAGSIFSCLGAVLAIGPGDQFRATGVLDRLSGDASRRGPAERLGAVGHPSGPGRPALGEAAPWLALSGVMRRAAGNCDETSTVCVGAIDRALGLLAAATGRLDDAVEHLALAPATEERIGAAPWLAHARVGLAGVRARRGGPGDTERARTETRTGAGHRPDVGE